MREHSSATPPSPEPLSSRYSGPAWGLLGILAFSFTVPLTKITLADDGFTALFVAAGRAVVAGLLAGGALALTGQQRPRGRQWIRLGIVAAGVVAGFPLLTSFALTEASAGHSAVVIALLPAATAVLAVLRGHERPPRAFWLTAAAGAVAATVFAAFRGGSFGGPHWSDLLLLGAVVAAACGYAEGGLLARELGAWQTISWALVLSAPVMVVLTGISVAQQPPTGSPAQWAAFAYLGVVSMYLGFLPWYRGLAIGPMTQVSQVQLAQPAFTLCWAALVLNEELSWATAVGAAAVIGCAASAVRTRLRRPPVSAVPRSEHRPNDPRTESTEPSQTAHTPIR
ncbi:DMT family transporter [Nocardia flavorosea]|uniref:DMT family transporter n=1 Tax=Nocardia flavorosea TaxID=53429 RepID=A0A846YMG3_9NOCA|nr:DMT family transporter [Nocardia flavorosea]NKY58119.1 DMT family transporter [Nocardia flavorosea]